jgi:hypothetical protein
MKRRGLYISLALDVKRVAFIFSMALLLFCLSACDRNTADSNQAAAPTEQPNGEAMPAPSPKSTLEQPSEDEVRLFEQFFEDSNIPEDMRGQFTDAIRGNTEAQRLILDRAGDELLTIYGAVFDPWAWGDALGKLFPRAEHERLYNVGLMYYSGLEHIGFEQDKDKAFAWLKLSADKSNSPGAIKAGDMVRFGEGITADEQAAYGFYIRALEIERSGAVFKRLGDCYAEGIGTSADAQMAFYCYLNSAMMGYADGLYKLSLVSDDVDVNLTALYKAAGSLNYFSSYWTFDGELIGESADIVKKDLINRLSVIWDNGLDPTVSDRRIPSNIYFPADFAEALIKAAYSFSYHAFAETHILLSNRTHEDAHIFRFFPDGDEPEEGCFYSGRIAREWSAFYEYDFDGCGVDEIAICTASGMGGSTMGIHYAILKKNDAGLYVNYSDSPFVSNRDNMQIIRFNGRIYFIYNPFCTKSQNPHDIVAYTIGRNGEQHSLTIRFRDYSPQHIITHTGEAYTSGYEELLSNVRCQAQTAITDSRYHRIFSPDDEVRLSFQPDDDLWGNYTSRYTEIPHPLDVFFVADIDNDGIDEVIHKGRSLGEWKSYFFFSWYEIYRNRDEFDNSTVSLSEPSFTGDSYELQSNGNLHEILPISNPRRNSVAQFWTHEHNGVTYCVVLHRYGMVYALQIFVIQNDETRLVSQSLFLDEAQGMDVTFSGS